MHELFYCMCSIYHVCVLHISPVPPSFLLPRPPLPYLSFFSDTFLHSYLSPVQGHFVQTSGLIGDIDTETVAQLIEHEIMIPPFSKAILDGELVAVVIP